MTYASQADALDLQRLGLLLLAATDMSRGGYVLSRYSMTHHHWQVTVRVTHPPACACAAARGCPGVVEHVASSRESLLYAMDRAVQWLRTAPLTLPSSGKKETA